MSSRQAGHTERCGSVSVEVGADGRHFKLDTAKSTYALAVTEEGYLGHAYYGSSVRHLNYGKLLRLDEYPQQPRLLLREQSRFMNVFPFEFPASGLGDQRRCALELEDAQGYLGCDLRYLDFELVRGKPTLEGLPSSYAAEDGALTLIILLEDPHLKARVSLFYSLFDGEEVIVRSACLENLGNAPLQLSALLSASLDLEPAAYQVLSLDGSWGRERQVNLRPLGPGCVEIDSRRGISSHEHNPFIALLAPGASQHQGEVYALTLCYSGNHLQRAELTEHGRVRLQTGINPATFGWTLQPGSSFCAPEAFLTYSATGLDGMTHAYHDFMRSHLLPEPFARSHRPVLANTWEAFYFNFDEDSLLKFARQAAQLGLELVVVDDGWFGERHNDESSLGDWQVNPGKFPAGLGAFARKLQDLGLSLGLWFEPEMLSPNSALYRAHPDWALQLPGRPISQCRSQYVLDLSNPAVLEHCRHSLCAVLDTAPIAYLKWDMNRSLDCVGSLYLPAGRQRELMHRYVLGVYSLLSYLRERYPKLLIEGCSGGGGRFDAGMLRYCQQIWCSDDMDVLERLYIQEGTALVYPLSTISCHVGAAQCSCTGRNWPLELRFLSALLGGFGYELNLIALSPGELESIKGQLKLHRALESLLLCGDYHRLLSVRENGERDAWCVVSKDRREALAVLIQIKAKPNTRSFRLRLIGLDPALDYEIEGQEGCTGGDELMHCGLPLDTLGAGAQGRLWVLHAR